MSIENIFLLLVALLGGSYDLKERRVPNWLTFGSFFAALIFYICQFKWELILNCLLGFTVGILILIIPYLMGWMGAGDVKLLGAIGAIVGLKGVILIYLYSAISGSCLGLIWILLKPGHLKFLITTGQILPPVEKKEKVPYGIAILLGTILYVIFRNSIVKFFNFLS